VADCVAGKVAIDSEAQAMLGIEPGATVWLADR